MNRILAGMVSATLLFSACTSSQKETDMNPLLQPYETPFEVPPFASIRNEHFMPAFHASIKAARATIRQIAQASEKPTFENTVLALERAGSLVDRVNAAFYNQQMANTNDTLDRIAVEVAPLLTAYQDDIYMNKNLFQRVKQVYEERDGAGLQGEDLRLVEETYKAFRRRGAELNDASQQRLREINTELSSLIVSFEQNVLTETNDFQLVIEDEADLSGLPENLIAQAAEWAAEAGKPGKWVFTLQNPSVMPFLTYADNRALRKRMMDAYLQRGNRDNAADNKDIVSRIVSLRVEQARLLGYESYAAYVLEEEMAGTPENVNKLLSQLWDAALPNGNREAAELQALIDAEHGGFTLAAEDWRYYANKLRQKQFSVTDETLQPYFALERVVHDGVFGLANSLYGLHFIERPDLPRYQDEVVVYEVQEDDGTTLGVLYMDYYARTNKRAGAWMSTFREQWYENGTKVLPIVTVVCNFPHPTADTPALLTQDDVETVFHEFGHALHGFLTDCKYRSLSGTNVPRDFVEMPSQIMENWAMKPEMLRRYAVHYETGAPMPEELIGKITSTGTYGQGFATVEYLAASMLDMDYHTLKTTDPVDVNAFEKAFEARTGLPAAIPSRYRTTYFLHLFSHGYAAGYYSYIWAEVLDADAFDAFCETGDLFNQTVARSFRKNILEKGFTQDPMALYKAFRGREPSIDPLLKRRGLKEELPQ